MSSGGTQRMRSDDHPRGGEKTPFDSPLYINAAKAPKCGTGDPHSGENLLQRLGRVIGHIESFHLFRIRYGERIESLRPNKLIMGVSVDKTRRYHTH